MYKLIKTKIKDGYSSSVVEGQSVMGNSFSIMYPDTGHLITEANISDIKEGCYICVMRNFYSFIKTSAVKNFSVEGSVVTIETETSEYKLFESEVAH